MSRPIKPKAVPSTPKDVAIADLVQDQEKLLQRWLATLLEDQSFTISDPEDGEEALMKEIGTILDQEEWDAKDTLRLAALFFLASFLAEDNTEEDEEDDED
jgi:hypothetical protein